MTANRCPSVLVPDGADINSTAVEAGTVVSFTCLKGFRMSSGMTFTTCSGEEWGNQKLLATCEGKRIVCVWLSMFLSYGSLDRDVAVISDYTDLFTYIL